MARSKVTFNKREKEKQRQKQKQEERRKNGTTQGQFIKRQIV